MKFSKIFMFILLIVVCLPKISFGQDVHQQIRKMEQARFLRMQEALFNKFTQIDQSGFDVNFYRIDLNIDPTAQSISGNVTMQATSTVPGLNQVMLNFFDNMQVDSVVSDGDTLNFTHNNNELNITLTGTFDTGTSFSVTIYYSGHPGAAGGFKSFDFGQHQGAPIISTLSEPFGSPAWWPCKDDPADKADSVDIIITVPDTLVVASNGKLIRETGNEDSTKTFFWAERYPISTYLVSLAISNYKVFSDYYKYSDTDSMEVVYYVYPEHLTAAEEDFNITVAAISYYSSIFREYPFIKEKYGMAEFQWSGAMEHQTCTSYGRSLISGNHRYDSYLVHELAHQWFGDLVTMKRWSHIWLNEGFASYAEALWSGHVGGEQAYFDYMNLFDQGLFPTSVFVYDSTNISELFSRTVYDKGAWVLHTLRHVMGDSAFFDALINYRTSFAFGNATTEDFRDICETEYGADLDWFFDQWVYGLYRPSYEFSWSDSAAGGEHVVTLTLDQVQTNTGLFKMPLDIVLTTFSGDTTFIVWDSLASQEFQFVMNEEAINLKIDPNNWVLKELLVDERVSVSGTIFSGDESSPLDGAQVYFVRIDIPTNTVVSIDTAFSDEDGKYSISVVPGFYQITTFHFDRGYLPSASRYVEIDTNTTDFNFVLISPALSTNLDSIYVFLNEGESVADTLTVTSTGVGPLLFSIAPMTPGGMSAKSTQHLPRLPLIPAINKSIVNSRDLTKNLPQIAAEPTSSWQLLYKDPADNVDGIFDIDETWMQVSDGNFYLKVTTHQQFGALDQFEYDLAIDADMNPNTGLFTGWTGIEYVIAISDFNGAYAALVKFVNGNFELVTLASYENIDPANNELTVAFPLATLGSARGLALFSQVVNPSNPYFDHDITPDENFGYFIFGLEEIPWLQLDSNFGIVPSSGAQSVILNIIPDALPAGHYDVNLVIANNDFANIPKIIPIKFDYITGVTEIQKLPKTFSLSQNYPNPFNSSTMIHYDLPQPGLVTLDIYNLLGQKIQRLIESKQPAGTYSIKWDGRDRSGNFVGSGVYFYLIQLNDKELPVRKMVVLR